MKKLYLAVSLSLAALFAASSAYAGTFTPPSKPDPTLQVKAGTQMVKEGKQSYNVTVKGKTVTSIAQAGSMSGMGGSHMGSSSVKFQKTSKNGICYYWWYYGYYYRYVWYYC